MRNVFVLVSISIDFHIVTLWNLLLDHHSLVSEEGG